MCVHLQQNIARYMQLILDDLERHAMFAAALCSLSIFILPFCLVAVVTIKHDMPGITLSAPWFTDAHYFAFPKSARFFCSLI